MDGFDNIYRLPVKHVEVQLYDRFSSMTATKMTAANCEGRE